MTSAKGPSISWTDFIRLVPYGAWIRWRVGAPQVIPFLEGIVLLDDTDETKTHRLMEDTRLRVQSTSQIDPVLIRAGDAEYKIDDEWINFRELCIRVAEQYLDDVGARADGAHPLQWMTHRDALNMSVAQIGTMLYETAAWIEMSGNRGYSGEDLMKALPALRIRILGETYRLAWENILFFGEGGKRRDFSGWGVHKRTPAHWTVTWLERFGLEHPQADALMNDIWDEALAGQEARAVKRASQHYVGIDLEQTDTREIAHKAASLWLLSRWAQHRAWQSREAREMWMIQARLYNTASDVFRHELTYRMDQQPQPRRSKKKTQAARDDWATASGYFTTRGGFDARRDEINALHFYTAAYITSCCESDSVPDVGVDFDALPRGLCGEVAVGETVDVAINQDEAEVENDS